MMTLAGGPSRFWTSSELMPILISANFRVLTERLDGGAGRLVRWGGRDKGTDSTVGTGGGGVRLRAGGVAVRVVGGDSDRREAVA